MEVVIGGDVAATVPRLVERARSAAAQETVLAMAAAKERHTPCLRAKMQEALDEGGDGTPEDLDPQLKAMVPELEKELPGCAA